MTFDSLLNVVFLFLISSLVMIHGLFLCMLFCTKKREKQKTISKDSVSDKEAFK